MYFVFSYFICPVYCSIDVSTCANKETIIMQRKIFDKQVFVREFECNPFSSIGSYHGSQANERA